MRYTDALLQRGDTVDVICLGDPDTSPVRVNGAACFRVQNRVPDEKGRFSYFARMLRFFLKSLARLTWNHLREPYDLIHVHSIPDTQVFAAAFAKLFHGTKVVLDIHDLLPELFANKFRGSTGSLFLFRALLLAEKASAAFADHVIISNHLWQKRITGRSVRSDKCSVILNYPDLSLFSRRPKYRNDGRFVIIYPGTLNFHQGLDIAIRAFSRIGAAAPHAELHIYGRGEERGRLGALISDLGLTGKVFLHDFLPLKDVATLMAGADLCVVPKRDDGFGGEAFSTKIFESMALGLPLVVSATRIDRYYFNDEVVKFFRPGDEEDLASSMLLLINNEGLRDRLAAKAHRFVQQHGAHSHMREYLALVDRLTGSTPGALPEEGERTSCHAH